MSLFLRNRADLDRLETLHALVHAAGFEAPLRGFEVAPTSVPFVV